MSGTPQHSRRTRQREGHARTLQDWSIALKAAGSRVTPEKGTGGFRFAPCPGCGGGTEDTGWVRPGNTSLVAGCNNGCRLPDIAPALFPNGPGPGRTMPPPDHGPSPDEEAKQTADFRAMVERWTNAKPCPTHAYLTDRGYSAEDTPKGLRMDGPGGKILLVPARRVGAKSENDVVGIQRIWKSKGWQKRYQKGSAPTSAHFPVSPPKTNRKRFYLAEGVATALAIYLAIAATPMDGTVVACFSAGNLEPVAVALAEKYPDAEFLIAADNDRIKPSNVNPGVAAAMKAAAAVDGKWCVPDIDGDYDDLYHTYGPEAVRKWLDPELAPSVNITPPEPDPPKEAPEPTPTPSATKPAPKAKRGKIVQFYDNELADLLDDADRLRWIYDPRRGWYFAPEDGWEWRQDHVACQLRALLRDRAERFAAENGRILKLRNTTTNGAVAMTQALVIDQPQWDSNPMIAGLPGGRVLDLATGDCRPTTRDEFVSRRLGVRPDPDASPPNRFLDFVNDMTRDDRTTEWLIAWLAYALTGHRHVSDHSVPMLVGDGGSGKTTLTLIAAALLGTYRVKLPADVLVARKYAREAHPEWLTRLDGSRLAIATEIPERGRIRSAVFKELTGDGDIRAHRMRQDSYEFTPTAKIMMYGNAPPALPGWDTGLKRRMVVVRCHSKPKAQRVEALARIIVDEEAPAILNHLANIAAVCFDRHNEGKAWLPDPSAVSETETTDLFDKSNPLGQAIQTLFTITGNPSDRIPSKDVRLRIQQMYDAEGWKNVPTAKTIATELQSHARKKAEDTSQEIRIFSKPQNGIRYWYGIAGRAS